MKPIKNSHFIFTDTDDGIKKIFLREKFFEFVCLLITDYYEKEIIENDFYKYFVNLLNDLDEDYGVFFIEHQMPTHWALSIIQNKHTTDNFDYDQRMKEISTKFERNNNLTSFVIDYTVLT
ncbi:hypothetical protein [Chryseobacterium foetidum]|uniref:hypothetical protein n=1 Tax=Chryseobacterium foetidum TaxID=2951057 RepID=UPI0021CA0985|nr:hypothetical protein [Chryseobacterium foetidum]